MVSDMPILVLGNKSSRNESSNNRHRVIFQKGGKDKPKRSIDEIESGLVLKVSLTCFIESRDFEKKRY